MKRDNLKEEKKVKDLSKQVALMNKEKERKE